MQKKFKHIVPLRSFKQNMLLSVIVPVYNEANGIFAFHERLEAALDQTPVERREVIYINDGSNDNSFDLLKTIADADPSVQIIDFSRNFGKEAAMTAGIRKSHGDAVVLIDADLQDPPELISKMVQKWQDGYDIVNMRRSSRAGETFIKKKTAQIFYTLMGLVGPVKMPENVGDFRLLSRRAIEALKQMPEGNRFMKGMFAWIGFPVKEILYQRDPRFADKTKWNYWGLFNLAVEGITSYTIAPLRLSTYMGLFVAITSFCYGTFIVINTLVYGDPVPGFPTLMVVILFLGGLQLMAIGIAGEYIGRIFLETKNRPLYLIKTHYQQMSAALSIPKKMPKKSVQQ
jgi:glycosyltransferase involved in cell wall biosynthesis